MSEENLEERENCLRNKITNIDRTLKDLRNTLLLKEQQNLDYQEQIAFLSKQGSKLDSELEQLAKKRQDKETHLIQKQKNHLELTAQLKSEVQKLGEILDKKIKEKQQEVDLNNTLGFGEKEKWSEEVAIKESRRDDLHHVVNRLNSSIMAKTQELEELRACIEAADSEKLEMIDMLSCAMHKMATAESVQPKVVLSTCDSNSLFNEVNDKRVEMKKSLDDLKAKCADMAKRIDSLERERMQLWQMRGEIQDILDNHPKEALSQYNALIEKYRATQESVEEGNLEYQKLIDEKEKLSLSSNCPDDIFSFNDEFIERKDETRERLQRLFRKELFANIEISKQTTESGRRHLTYHSKDTHVLKDIAETSSLIKEMERHACENKNKDPPCETANKVDNPVAPSVKKKVLFNESVVSPPPRRRGRLLQSTPIFIPNDLLEKQKAEKK